MNVVVPYKESYSVPQTCCICGAANPTAKFQIQSKQSRNFATKASVTMTFMECQVCVDEHKAIRRTERPGLFIGGGIGLLTGVVIGLALFLSSSDASAIPNDILNELLGPLCAVGAIFGLIGLLIAKAIWSITLKSGTRQKLKLLESPVSIVGFSFETGWLGNIKSAVVKLNFVNDAYGKAFMVLNNGLEA